MILLNLIRQMKTKLVLNRRNYYNVLGGPNGVFKTNQQDLTKMSIIREENIIGEQILGGNRRLRHKSMWKE
jgi:hypothetical protein